LVKSPGTTLLYFTLLYTSNIAIRADITLFTQGQAIGRKYENSQNIFRTSIYRVQSTENTETTQHAQDHEAAHPMVHRAAAIRKIGRRDNI
jgi:hypothetical protein